MPLPLGYVDVRTGLSTASPQLQTFPLAAIVAAPPLNEPPPDVFTLLASNQFDVVAPAGIDLLLGAVVTRNDDTGQTLEFLVSPGAGITDAEILVRVNTSVFTHFTDYTANPTPPRGERFVVVGARSDGAGVVPVFGAVLGSTKGVQPVEPDDVTAIKVTAAFDQPRNLVVGQVRQKTAAALYTSTGAVYRRAVDGEAEGMLMELTLHDPTSTERRWVHVDLTQPRSGDGPARAPVTSDPGGMGGIQTGDLRRYQVTWVHAHANETSPSPPSPTAQTLSGRIRVPLPVWVDPVEPGLAGPVVPEPIVARRIYRTVGSPDGSAGEALLVHEEANNTAVEWIDDQGDNTLGVPLLTELTVTYRHTIDRDATQLAAGLATFGGRLTRTSYEEDAGGARQLAGTIYAATLHATPPVADITYTTRAATGTPRVTWRSATAAGPAGVGNGTIAVIPTGAEVGRSQFIDVALDAVPPAFGIDWFTRGATRTKVEIGNVADTGKPLARGVGLVRLRAADTGGLPPTATGRAVNIDLTPEALTAVAGGIRRVRLLLGLPRPLNTGSPGPGGDALSRYAELDDGIVAEIELDATRGPRPRSLRVRRDSVTNTGRDRMMVRVGELPDTVVLDARPGSDFRSTGVSVTGRLHRVMVLVQTAAEVAGSIVTNGRRRDGAWFAVTDSGESLDVFIDGPAVDVKPSTPATVTFSLRSAEGRGPADFVVHQAQATLTTASPVHLSTPSGGATEITASNGATGRLSVSTRALDPALPDHLVAVRATPQLKLALDTISGRRLIDDATLRWLGLTGVHLPKRGDVDPFTVSLTGTRANKAFRAHAIVTDDRLDTNPTWDLAKVRVVDLPETVSLLAHPTADRYHLVLNRRSGRVVVFAQPPLVPASGEALDELVGIGLAKADIEALPTETQVDLLGPNNDLQSTPFNATPDDDWKPSGFRVDTDGELVARGLQMVTLARIRPGNRKYFWNNLAASLIRITSDNDDPPGPVWLWTPSAPNPSASSSVGTWDDVESWIGYKIEAPSLVTMQIQAYKDHLSSAPQRWNDPLWNWLLQAEFQMKDYRGEVTVDADLSPEGDDDAGPGQWYLRVPDGAPFNGQVVFGNTGGWISNRPRIFAPFTL